MFIYTLYSAHLWKFDSECVALTLGAEKQKGTVFKYLSLTHKKNNKLSNGKESKKSRNTSAKCKESRRKLGRKCAFLIPSSSFLKNNVACGEKYKTFFKITFGRVGSFSARVCFSAKLTESNLWRNFYKTSKSV